MSGDTATADTCPMHAGRDDRKTAQAMEENLKPFPGARVSRNFNFSREILRSQVMRQAGANADDLKIDNPDHVSFFFLDGERHRQRRMSVAGYFTPKAVVTRYEPIMQRTMDEMIADLRARGTGVLDEMSFFLAANVTMDIVGLTTEGRDKVKLAKRLRTILNSSGVYDRRPLQRFIHDVLLGWFHKSLFALRVTNFYLKDIVPAAKERRREPREDVMSYMVKEGYSKKAMIIECLTYGGAGISTTREFMVMAAWHLFEKPELMARFLEGSEEDQNAILQEILRLEPIAGFLYRRSTEDISQTEGGPVRKDDLLAVHIRASNTDEAVVGNNPCQLDPDRAKRIKNVGTYLSFGDGPHRCPGSHVALHETRIFLDRLLRVPGIRLQREPKVGWNLSTQGYELRGAVVACDRA